MIFYIIGEYFSGKYLLAKIASSLYLIKKEKTDDPKTDRTLPIKVFKEDSIKKDP